MHSSIHTLLQHAEMKMTAYDLHSRSSLEQYNRTLPCYIISYHKRGCAKFRMGETVYHIGPETVLCIPPGILHDHYKDSSEETKFLWWHFTYQLPGCIDVLKLFKLPLTFKLNDTAYFEQVFHQFIEATKRQDLFSRAILRQAKALELLYIVLENAVSMRENEESGQATNLFYDVLTDILQHPEHPISLRDLSTQLHMHPTYISNRFKELYQLTPLQFQQEVRIRKAKTWLLTTGMNVTEISEKLGYPDVQSFSKVFKSKTQSSPMRYRLNRKGGDMHP